MRNGNPVLVYLQDSEVQYDTEEQRANIVTALRDVLDLGEDALRVRRYEDYAGNPDQWDLSTLLYRHVVPARKGATLGGRFYRDVQAPQVRVRIAEILATLE